VPGVVFHLVAYEHFSKGLHLVNSREALEDSRPGFSLPFLLIDTQPLGPVKFWPAQLGGRLTDSELSCRALLGVLMREPLAKILAQIPGVTLALNLISFVPVLVGL